MENHILIDEYLKHVDLDYPISKADDEYLNRLHIAHLTHIPFETFDLIDIKELNISFDYVFNRLVRQNRGGVCFQMNGLFEFVLKHFNYDVQLIQCDVYSDFHKCYRNIFSHVSLYVKTNNDQIYLCDVGFSRDFLTPLIFRMDCVQYATNGFFRLTKTEDNLHYQVERGFINDNEKFSLSSLPSSFPHTYIIDINPECITWMKSYRFRMDFFDKPTKIEDFQEVCSTVLYSPEVLLNQTTLCHLHVFKPIIGSYIIFGKDYIERKIENGKEIRQTYSLENYDDKKIKNLLKEKFNLSIERTLQFQRLR